MPRLYDRLLIWTLIERPALSCGVAALSPAVGQARGVSRHRILPHSRSECPADRQELQKDVKNRGNELNKSFRINKSPKKRTQNELETNWKNVLKMRKKGQNEPKN